MKDEIKEILESLDKIAKSKYYPEDLLTYKECQLLDYITTLQDTLKDREEYCYGLETQLTNLQERKILYRYTPEKGFELVGDEE